MSQTTPTLAVLLLTFFFTGQATAQTPSPSHLVEIGVADSLYSDILGEQRHLWIHLPSGGDLQANQRYPVIYLLDGGQHLGGLAMVQAYYDHFRLPEMIVVGISNRNNRTRDLTPSEVDMRNGMPVAVSGGAERFTRFLAEELIPYIDRAYPTAPHRTLIGHSYGGLFTINTLIHHRDLFTNYIAIDPSLDWDDQEFLGEATAALAEDDFSGKGLFVSMANELIRFTETLTLDDVMQDTTVFSLGIRSILEFVQTAEAHPSNGLRFSWAYYEQDIHGTVPLVSMRDGLVFLYDWWELKRPSRYNDPSSSAEELVTLIRERNAALTAGMGYPFFMEEELLEMLGHMSADRGQPEKAHAIFELWVEYYPESANAHAALADSFEAQNRIAQALQHARQAFALSGSEAHKAHVDALSQRR